MQIDLAPLLRGEHGGQIRIAGVRVGDAAAGIDREALTGAEENAPGEARTYSGGKVYRTGADGRLVEVPLAERVEATLQRGGFLRCGPIALRVKDGAIERVFVRGPSLASLGVASEEDITARLGPAQGHEHSLGCRLHHYPDRGVVIAWHSREGRVEHVALGAEPWHEPRLGAKELLAELLRSYELVCGAGETAPTEGSARVRYLRIAALARALGLGDVPALVQGEFLDGALDPVRCGVLEEIAARGPRGAQTPYDPAAFVFRLLLSYRRDVYRVVHATSGWIECSNRVLLGMIFTQNEIGSRLEAMMTDVDRWLCTLMDPEARTIELRELVARHGWPDVDLEALEQDEL